MRRVETRYPTHSKYSVRERFVLYLLLIIIYFAVLFSICAAIKEMTVLLYLMHCLRKEWRSFTFRISKLLYVIRLEKGLAQVLAFGCLCVNGLDV